MVDVNSVNPPIPKIKLELTLSIPNDVIIVYPNQPKVKSAGFVGNVGTAVTVVSVLLSTIILLTR